MNSEAVLDSTVSQAEPMALGVVQLTSQTRLTNNNWPTIRVKLSVQNKQQIVGPFRRGGWRSSPLGSGSKRGCDRALRRVILTSHRLVPIVSAVQRVLTKERSVGAHHARSSFSHLFVAPCQLKLHISLNRVDAVYDMLLQQTR